MNPCDSGLGQLQPAIILNWLPDETFYSICSRQHIVWGNHKPAASFRMLFDSIAPPIKHDFPHCLDGLNCHIRSIWGGPESIIHKHTIFPLFIPFQSQHRIQTVLQMLKGESQGSIKFQLGLLTGGFGADHALKACNCCIEADISQYGVAYWHVAHQFPGVLICPIHNVWLQESILNRRWSGRFQFALPHQAALTPLPDVDLAPNAMDTLEKQASSILDLVSIGASRCFDPLLVSSVYRVGLNQNGYVPNFHHAATSLAQHTSLLQPLHPFTSLPTTVQKAATYIQHLVRSPRGHCHPLKHLVMITWLFGSVEAFIDIYDRLAAAPEPDDPHKKPAPYTNKQTLGPSPPNQTAKLKPKTLKPFIRAQILRQLSRGIPKIAICNKFGITISTVNKLLRVELQVKELWEMKNAQLELESHRADWASLSHKNQSSSASIVRSLNPKLYAWLYRNDKAWLLDQCSRLPTGRKGNNSKIDWHKRDVELERLVQDAIEILFTRGSDVGMNRIYTLVPSLFKCLQNSNRYPRTRALLLSLKQRRLIDG